MFAVVRTGGKQYRVALGDKIVVEKVAGEAGQRIDITDVLLAGEGSELKSVKGLIVGAEIIAQAKADKVTVFKKRRRHNYRRKKGHRQQHTILKIVAIGDQKEPKKAAPKAEPTPKADKAAPKAEPDPKSADTAAPNGDVKPAAHAKEAAEVQAAQHEASDVAGTPTENPLPDNASATPETANEPAPAVKKASSPKPKGATPSTENAAPAKSAAKKAPKAK
jgi:large subunit ribosomal protein L21